MECSKFNITASGRASLRFHHCIASRSTTASELSSYDEICGAILSFEFFSTSGFQSCTIFVKDISFLFMRFEFENASYVLF